LVYAGRRDEFGQIAFAMKMLETEAGAMVGRIGDASRQLSQHAHELLGAMDSSTQSASRQQSETDQVATAINQMAVSVQEVASNAQRTAEAASRADSEAATGTEVVNRTGAAIGRLAQDIQQAGDVIHELEAHSNDITKVLDVIRGIAEQTNLLALNAAIEAARSLQGINSRVNEISAMSMQIAAAVEQQSSVSENINQNIVSIRGGSDQHVESGLRSRQSASGVAELASSMEMLVQQFWTRRRG